MSPHPYGPRDAVVTDLAGVVAGALVIACANGDAIALIAGLVLAVAHAVLLTLVLARPDAPWHFDVQRHLSTPLALTISLVVSARLLPEHVYFIALFWVLFAALFNFLLFRSKALNAFLAGYLIAAAAVSFAVVALPPFLTGSLIFLSLATGYVLAYQARVLTTLQATLTRREGEVLRASLVDRATGLPNRQAFLDRLAPTLHSARRRGFDVLVVVLDVEEWAVLRERLGNEGVVALLGSISGALSRTARLVAISGSDRLLVALGSDGDDEAQVRRCLDDCPGDQAVAGERHPISVTAGYARFPADGEEPELLVLRAEEAALSARQDARGRVRRYDPAESATRRDQHALEKELRLAVERAEFMLLYQPKVDRHGTAHGCEALIRWNHPEQRNIGPARFIPALERLDLIGPVGDWALDQALAQARTWRDLGFPISIAVNLSPRQLTDARLPHRVADLLGKHELPGGALELEVTEGMLLHDLGNAKRLLGALRELGVKSSVDDFGTGYSSLNRLIELPIDVIKVDKSFVDHIGVSRQGEGVVRLILGMARQMEKRTVAEGVETRDQLQLLIDEGCDLYQGYHFARPLSAAAFLDYVGFATA